MRNTRRTWVRALIVLALVLVLSILPVAIHAATVVHTIALATVGSSGNGGNDDARASSISADGTKIAFSSSATDLISGLTTVGTNIFLYDISDGSTTLLTAGSSGNGGNGSSQDPSISEDGTKIAFYSYASDLVGAPANGLANVFLYDTSDGSTTLVTTGSSGFGSNGAASHPSISADGTKIAFMATSTDLTIPPTNGTRNIFLYDASDSSTTLITTGAFGDGGNWWSEDPSISADGTKIAFASNATDLTIPPANGSNNIFLYNVSDSSTTLMTTGSSGIGDNGDSLRPSISADGTRVAFHSNATDLTNIPSNGLYNIFLHDASDSSTILVTAGPSDNGGNYTSLNPSISGNGERVIFQSTATDLIDTPTTSQSNVFLYDASDSSTTLVTAGPLGNGGNGWSSFPTISFDGMEIAFLSNASDLTVVPTNGSRNVFFWVRTTYVEVTFDARNGTNPVIMSDVVQGSRITAPTPAPIRTGYTFDGWWTAPVGGTHWNFATGVVDNDMTLYGQWIKDPEPFTLIYLPGTTDKVFNLPFGGGFFAGDMITVAKAPTRFDHRLLGYQIAPVSLADAGLFTSRLLQPGQTFIMPETNLHATAIWQRIWSIVINPGDGGPPIVIEIDDGGLLAAPPAPTRPGYEFVGWFNADGTPFDFSKPITGPVEFFAGWRKAGTPATSDTTAVAGAFFSLLAGVGVLVSAAYRKRG